MHFKFQDDLLINLAEALKCKDWKTIAQHFENRSPIQCLHRWSKILKPGLVKGAWTIDEDKKLINWVESEGPYKWTECSKVIEGRIGKQCRERWFNSLNPVVKKGAWSVEEDFIIFKRFSENGSKWSKIAAELPGRTENSIKNIFYSTLRSFATQQINKRKSKNKISENSLQVSAMSLSKLLTYFPMALEEKTRNISFYEDINSNFDNSSKIKTKFLSFKTKRPSGSTLPQFVNNPTVVSNIGDLSLHHFDKNINKTLIMTNRIEEIHNSDFSYNINNGSFEAFFTIYKDFNKTNNSIKKELNEKMSEIVEKNTQNSSEKFDDSLNINYTQNQADSISNLISQLDDLEKYLQTNSSGLNDAEIAMNLVLNDDNGLNIPENPKFSSFLQFFEIESDNKSLNLIFPDANHFYNSNENKNFLSSSCFNSDYLYNLDLYLDESRGNLVDGYLK